MDQLLAMFCDVDDFCKVFEPVYERRLLRSGQRQRRRSSQLRKMFQICGYVILTEPSNSQPE